MILITDSNILFSAVVKPNSLISKILKKERNFQFVAPNYLLEEFKKHRKNLEEGSGLSANDFKKEWESIKSRIQFIKMTDIPKDIFFKSYEIVKDIDEWDVYFVALHFKTGHKLWTGDKALISGLKNKGYEICVTTEDLKEHLYKKQSP